ncbi:MAG TPA: hypothetical protein DHW39_04210 [Erysipelotrichaceae bacterium]|nr:hypothetical protein [Erysipelotrichaceae bacterium]
MTYTITHGILQKYEGNEETAVIPSGVTEIADYAFYGARNLKSVIIPDTVTMIGNDVFYDCEELEEIVIPDSVMFLGSGIFARCASLRKVKFSDRLTSLPKITFYQCASLREVILPNMLKRIGRACFEQCRSLPHLRLPETMQVIEDNAFDDCVSLSAVNLPEGLREIGNNVFFGCVSLRRLDLPSSLETIGKGAFETRGVLTLKAPENIRIRSMMLDNNWNMNWNFGSNGRYNGKNEDNYQLVFSSLSNVDLSEWKPEAQCILAVNYLETYEKSIDFYDEWIREDPVSCLEMIITKKRWDALNNALSLGLIPDDLIERNLSRINDREEKAILLERNRKKQSDFSDLLDMLDGF